MTPLTLPGYYSVISSDYAKQLKLGLLTSYINSGKRHPPAGHDLGGSDITCHFNSPLLLG